MKCISVFLLGLIIIIQGCQSQYESRKNSNVIVVFGEGTVKVNPDFFDLTFAIVSRNKDYRKCQEDNIQKTEEIIHLLKQEYEIEENNMWVQDYRLNEELEYDRDLRKQIRVGYISNNVLRVRLHSREEFRPLLLDLLDRGVNQIQDIHYGIKEPGEYQIEAVSAAYESAYKKAKILATKAGHTLGDVISISEDLPSFSYQQLGKRNFSETNPKMTSSTVIVPLGEQQIKATVEVVFKLF